MPAVTKLTEIRLDVGGTFEKEQAVKHDGYAETPRSVTSISAGTILSLTAPIPISAKELMSRDTPAEFPNEAAKGYVKFSNSWLAMGSPTETPKEIEDRGRREAQSHTRIQRQRVSRDAMDHNVLFGDSFKMLAMGIAVMGVIAVLVIAALAFLKG